MAEKADQQETEDYVRELIAYAKAFADICISHFSEEGRIPRPVITFPQPPPSIRPWAEEHILATSKRILTEPNLRERIEAVSQFINRESHNLVKHAGSPGFMIQQAYNFAADGPVGAAADIRIGEQHDDQGLFLRDPHNRPRYNPYPAMLRVLEMESRYIPDASGMYGRDRSSDFRPVLALTADGHRAVSANLDNAVLVWDVESGRCASTGRATCTSRWTAA